LGKNEHWFRALPSLVDRAECFFVQMPLLEMRGTGCSVSGVTQLTASLVESLVEEPVVLVGNSLGGHVALRVALSRPELVRGLVLVGSSGLFERSLERDVQHSPSEAWLQRKIGELFYDPGNMWPEMVEEAFETLSRRTAARALVKLGRSAKRDHLGEELPRIDVPCLIAWGKQDTVTPPEVAEQFASLLPRSELRWIDRCGHAPQIERGAELGELIRGYLGRLGGAGFGDGSGSRGQQGVA
jgi:pimeloyl-ACP methyl ester carboxylesterase